MHSIHLTFSDLKGTHTHIGKRHMHAFNESIICKKEREVLHWDYRYETSFLVHADCSRWAWTILLVNSCILIIQFEYGTYVKCSDLFTIVILIYSVRFANKRIPAVIIVISTCLNVLFSFLWCHVYLLEEFISWMFTFSSISTCRECWHCREATREVTVHLLLNCTQFFRVKTIFELNADIKHRIVIHCKTLFMLTTKSFKFRRISNQTFF